MSSTSNHQSATRKNVTARWQIVSCYIVSIFIAYIFLQYMGVKFNPDPDSGVIFRDLEAWAGYDWVNPYFRYFTGGLEVVAAAALFVPGLQIVGAIISLVTMLIAIYLHVLGPIGIEGGRGLLALENVAVQLCALWIIYVRRREIMDMIRFMLTDRTLIGKRAMIVDQ